MSPEVTFKLDTVPLNICISMQPLTVAEMKARVKCEVSVYKEREISFQVPTSIFYAYTRLFVHVFGNQDLIKSCKKVQMSSFYSSTGQNMVQPKLFSNISRANEDKYQLKITSFSRQIEVSSQLNLAIVDYQALMEKGNADKTTLILADDPEFLKNVVRDDTKAIQVCRKEGYDNDTDKFFYVRVQLKTIETEPVKIKIIVQN
ncbi:MAG: hypothetical protein EOM68_29710, partial [Spirochaetia bacterium]|nr:hypothetical protein [Spirochaetia bacterium]